MYISLWKIYRRIWFQLIYQISSTFNNLLWKYGTLKKTTYTIFNAWKIALYRDLQLKLLLQSVSVDLKILISFFNNYKIKITYLQIATASNKHSHNYFEKITDMWYERDDMKINNYIWKKIIIYMPKCTNC